MEHLDEQTIELFILDSSYGGANRENIQKHLQSCPACASLFQQIALYYESFNGLWEAREKSALAETTAVQMAVQASPIRPNRQRVMSVVWGYATRYPIRTGLSATLLLGLLALTYLKGPSADSPSYARAKAEFLVAYDADGNELWKKHIGPKYDISNHTQLGDPLDPSASFAITIDVDRNGLKEVVAVFGVTESGRSNLVVCYNHDGTERWQYAFHRNIRFGETSFADDYHVEYVTEIDCNTDGRPEILAYGRNSQYYPSALFILNGDDGTLVNEYWHAGWFYSVLGTDLDQDGIKDFVFGGVNNSFNQAAVVVFDSRMIRGFGPTTPELRPHDAQPGSERAYVILPPSDLGILADKPRNSAHDVRMLGDYLQVKLAEHVRGQPMNTAIVLFDRAMSCIKVGEHDDFAVAYNRFKADGLKLKPLKDMYGKIRSNIRYWDGRQFVEHPVLKSFPSPLSFNQP